MRVDLTGCLNTEVLDISPCEVGSVKGLIRNAPCFYIYPTYLACKARAKTPTTLGAAADVPP